MPIVHPVKNAHELREKFITAGFDCTPVDEKCDEFVVRQPGLPDFQLLVERTGEPQSRPEFGTAFSANLLPAFLITEIKYDVYADYTFPAKTWTSAVARAMLMVAAHKETTK